MKIQNQDIKSAAELVAAGATAASLPNDDKIYVSANGLNKTLKDAIVAGEIGGGGGGIGDFAALSLVSAKGIKLVSDIPLQGKNASFDGGGSLTGTLSLTTTASEILFDTQSVKYASAANNQGDYFGWTYAIPGGLGGITASLEFFYRTGANPGSFRLAIKIVGGALNGNIEYIDLENTGGVTKQVQKLFAIPSDATSIKYGIQNNSTSTSALSFLCDRISLSANPFGKANLYTMENWNTWGSANLCLSVRTGYLRFDFSGLNIYRDSVAVPSSALTGNTSGLIKAVDDGSKTIFTAIRNCKVFVNASAEFAGQYSVLMLNYKGLINKAGSMTGQASQYSNVAGEFALSAGESFYLYASGTINNSAQTFNLDFNAIAETPAVLSKGGGPLTDWIDFTPVYNTASFGPAAITNTNFKYRRNGSNMQIQGEFSCTQTQSVANWFEIPEGYNVDTAQIGAAFAKSVGVCDKGWTGSGAGSNTMLITTSNSRRFYIGGSMSGGTPAALTIANADQAAPYGGNLSFYLEVPILEWKGLSGMTTALPASKENNFSARFTNNGSVAAISSQGPSSFIQSVTRVGSPSGNVYVAWIPGFFTQPPAVTATGENANWGYNCNVYNVTTSGCYVQASTAGGSGVDINFNLSVQRQASDAFDTGKVYVGQVSRELVAVLSDQQPSGTHGGSYTSGSWLTRTLNTLSGDTSFLTLSSNRFTLLPGVYEIDFLAPANGVDGHTAKLVEDPAGTPIDKVIGTAARTSNTYYNYVTSVGKVKFEITTSKTFEIQNRCSTTSNGDGYGRAASLGVNEVYTVVKIRKLA